MAIRGGYSKPHIKLTPKEAAQLLLMEKLDQIHDEADLEFTVNGELLTEREKDLLWDQIEKQKERIETMFRKSHDKFWR
jgi:chaperonin cofactor prefoldin